MATPLVSVICLCYNHTRFVRDAINSVLNQTHSAVQLIVVDDASTDGSQDHIRTILGNHPEVIFISLDRNMGNCRAFNAGLELATGDFIIDLAADDVLYPRRIEEGISAFNESGPLFCVNYSDAELISESGERIGFHSDRFSKEKMPSGDVYKDVIGRYFINSPTMMIRMSVMQDLGGYDEKLAYEDFDFLIRSSREYLFCYTPRPLIKRRLVGNSMSRLQYKRNSPQLFSTFLICLKIKAMNRTAGEDAALRRRIWYEGRKAFAVGEMGLAMRYAVLYWKVLVKE